MIAVIAGLLGGLIGAAAMLGVRTADARGEPPGPALLLARISGGDARDYPTLGMLLQLGYGALLGVAFVHVTARVPGWSVSVADWTTALPDHSLSFPAWDERLWVAGLLYGIVLGIVGLAFWAPVIGLRERLDALDAGPRARRTALLIGAHVVYGLILGAVVQALLA